MLAGMVLRSWPIGLAAVLLIGVALGAWRRVGLLADAGFVDRPSLPSSDGREHILEGTVV